MNFSPQVRQWLINISMIVIWGMTAAGIAITSGAKTWGVVSAVVLSIFTNLLHSLMTAPQNAQVVQDAKDTPKTP
jgi:uncharacterized membrane protein YhiD involved in acid resistance